MNFFSFNFLFFFASLSWGIKTYACDEWFKSLKITDVKNCESICRTSPTDMASFSCPELCDKLCKKHQTEKAAAEENLYGLTDREVSFCSGNKLTCIKAYKLSWNADSTCLKIYPKSRHNDESDACRHYVWAMLMSRDIGTKDAEIILNAHENNLKEPQAERAMDLANNRQSQIDYLKLKNSKLTEEIILEKFKENIKNGKFIIIDPNYLKGGLP